MSEFEQKFPKPDRKMRVVIAIWKSQKEGWLAAFKYLQERAKLHHRGGNIFNDIKQEIEELAKEKE